MDPKITAAKPKRGRPPSSSLKMKNLSSSLNIKNLRNNRILTKETPWNDETIKLLVKLRLKANPLFKNSRLVKSQLWKRISNKLNAETGYDYYTAHMCVCKWGRLLNKIRRMKVKLSRGIENGKGRPISQWPYYEDCLNLEQNSSRNCKSDFSGGKRGGGSNLRRYSDGDQSEDASDSTQSQRNLDATEPTAQWTVQAAKELIRQRVGMESSFTGPGPWRPAHELWGQISKELSKRSYSYSWHQCQRRWKYMMTKFLMIRDEEKSHENLDQLSRNRTWPFYDDIFNYIVGPEKEEKRLFDGNGSKSEINIVDVRSLADTSVGQMLTPEHADALENIEVVDLCTDDEEEEEDSGDGEDVGLDFINKEVIYSNEDRFWTEPEEHLENPACYSTDESECETIDFSDDENDSEGAGDEDLNTSHVIRPHDAQNLQNSSVVSPDVTDRTGKQQQFSRSTNSMENTVLPLWWTLKENHAVSGEREKLGEPQTPSAECEETNEQPRPRSSALPEFLNIQKLLSLYCNSNNDKKNHGEQVTIGGGLFKFTPFDTHAGHQKLTPNCSNVSPKTKYHRQIWTHEATKRLIELRSGMRMKAQKIGRKTRNKFWAEIAETLKSENHHYSYDSCIRRWSHLLTTFKRTQTNGYYGKKMLDPFECPYYEALLNFTNGESQAKIHHYPENPENEYVSQAQSENEKDTADNLENSSTHEQIIRPEPQAQKDGDTEAISLSCDEEMDLEFIEGISREVVEKYDDDEDIAVIYTQLAGIVSTAGSIGTKHLPSLPIRNEEHFVAQNATSQSNENEEPNGTQETMVVGDREEMIDRLGQPLSIHSVGSRHSEVIKVLSNRKRSGKENSQEKVGKSSQHTKKYKLK